MNFFNLTREDLEFFFIRQNIKKYAARQLFKWVYQKLVFDFQKMSDLSRENRKRFSGLFSFDFPGIEKILESQNDNTKKFLFKLEGNNFIETVLMQQKRNTVCLSTEVGCPIKCIFCLSGQNGLERKLNTAEIISQVILIAGKIYPEKINNLVYMGIGEPLDNLPEVIKSVRILTDDNGFSMPSRNITISTAGLPEEIIELADSGVKVNLSLSLHSAIEDNRNKIIPLGRKYKLQGIRESLFYYQDKTKRKITIEYIPFKDFNTSKEDIKYLKKFLSGTNWLINLIPYHKNDTTSLILLSKDEMENFKSELIAAGFLTIIRRSLGKDILAACGELRSGK